MRLTYVATGAAIIGATVSEARSVASSPATVEKLAKRQAFENRPPIEPLDFGATLSKLGSAAPNHQQSNAEGQTGAGFDGNSENAGSERAQSSYERVAVPIILEDTLSKNSIAQKLKGELQMVLGSQEITTIPSGSLQGSPAQYPGTLLGGLVTNVPVGGLMANTPVGGLMSNTPIGGLMSNTPIGGVLGNTPISSYATLLTSNSRAAQVKAENDRQGTEGISRSAMSSMIPSQLSSSPAAGTIIVVGNTATDTLNNSMVNSLLAGKYAKVVQNSNGGLSLSPISTVDDASHSLSLPSSAAQAIPVIQVLQRNQSPGMYRLATTHSENENKSSRQTNNDSDSSANSTYQTNSTGPNNTTPATTEPVPVNFDASAAPNNPENNTASNDAPASSPSDQPQNSTDTPPL
ncbi:expressed protein, partial [Phakopsora pachyrhizi]